jgi:hypothetical protein
LIGSKHGKSRRGRCGSFLKSRAENKDSDSDVGGEVSTVALVG